MFGNDLLDELSKNAYCFMMYGLQCGFPSYADDLLLLSLLKRGMNYLMDICFANPISEQDFGTLYTCFYGEILKIIHFYHFDSDPRFPSFFYMLAGKLGSLLYGDVSVM